MFKIKIVKDSNPSLRKKSVEVVLPLDERHKEIISSMRQYLINSQDPEYSKTHNIRSGIGLAAPQIGINERFFVIYLQDENKLYDCALINPVIVEESAKMACLAGGEGCLSVDKDHEGLVHRHNRITIKAYDAISNSDVVLHLQGLAAICFQHEYDHLNGILFYDRIDAFRPNDLKPGEVEY